LIHPLKFASLAAAVALVAASAAHADTVTLTLSAPTATYMGGTETLTYEATAAASSMNGADVFLNGDSLNVQSPLTSDDTDSLNFPISLSPGDSFTGDLFTVTVPDGTALGFYPGSFVLQGGSDGGTYDTLATDDFTVTVTPEPSSLALLTSGTLALGALATGRRRVRRA
jgi:opacity protein-like surface antigen